MTRLKHAYLIMAHKRMDQLEKLLRVLDYSYNDIYLHIDAKVNRRLYAGLAKSLKYSELVLIEPKSLAWGGFTQIETELRLLKTAYESNHAYAYYHLISGQDLPLRPQEDIHNYFDQNSGIEFVTFTGSDGIPLQYKDRVSLYHPFTEIIGSVDRKYAVPLKVINYISKTIQHLFRVDRTRKDNYKSYMGSAWYSITNDFASYMVEHMDQVLTRYKWTICGDEVYTQTLLMRSPYSKNVAEDDIRLIIWDEDAGSRPHTFTISDFELIDNSKCIFARKFDADIDEEVIDKVIKLSQSSV